VPFKAGLTVVITI